MIEINGRGAGQKAADSQRKPTGSNDPKDKLKSLKIDARKR
jgi:hypothetical protein